MASEVETLRQNIRACLRHQYSTIGALSPSDLANAEETVKDLLRQFKAQGSLPPHVNFDVFVDHTGSLELALNSAS